MRSSQPSPLAGLIGAPAPRRSRSGSRSRMVGWILGIVVGVLVLMAAIGFGVDQQAQHHIVSSTMHTTQVS